MTNTQILCFVLGWQGGTVHQVADALKIEPNWVLMADDNYMQILCRRAQQVRNGYQIKDFQSAVGI